MVGMVVVVEVGISVVVLTSVVVVVVAIVVVVVGIVVVVVDVDDVLVDVEVDDEEVVTEELEVVAPEDDEVVAGEVVVGAAVVVVVGSGNGGSPPGDVGTVVANGAPIVVLVSTLTPPTAGTVDPVSLGSPATSPPPPCAIGAAGVAAGERPVSQLTPAKTPRTNAPAVTRTISPEMTRPTKTLLRRETRLRLGPESARRCAICFARSPGSSLPGRFVGGNELSFPIPPPHQAGKL